MATNISQVMRCASGRHELALRKYACPFCELDRLRDDMETLAVNGIWVKDGKLVLGESWQKRLGNQERAE
jgi:hypothetical protein